VSLSSFESLSQIFKSVSKLSLVYALDPESIVCSAILANLASAREVDFELAPFFEAPKPIDSSSILILCGVRQHRVVGGVRIKLLQDILGVKRFSVIRLVKEAQELWVVSPEQVALAVSSSIASSQGSSYDDRVLEAVRGELSEIISSGILAINEHSLRLFRYPFAKLSECLFRTIEPYAPGVSLSINGSRGLLEEVGVPDKLGPLEEDELKKLSSKLSEIYKSYNPKGFEPLGWRVVARTSENMDINELSYSMLAAIDAELHEAIISSLFDFRYTKLLVGLLERFYKRIGEYIEAAIRGEMKGGRMYIRGARVEQWEASSKDPLNTLAKLLRAHGISSSLTIFRVEDSYCIPLTQINPSWPLDQDELAFERGCVCSSSMDKLVKVLL